MISPNKNDVGTDLISGIKEKRYKNWKETMRKLAMRGSPWSEDEKTALKRIFKAVNEVRRQQNCTHAVLVGHNAHFDLGFVQAAIARTGTKNQNPFHSFSVFDTVTLSAVMFGQTVLAKSCIQAGIEFDGKEAHSALYDTQKTAELFCYILNKLAPHLLDTLVADQ